MNLILTRSYQKQSSAWEPFATSTPLKAVPNNVNREKQFQKEFHAHSNSFDIIKKLQKGCTSADVLVKKLTESKQLVSKRPRKNKSCANFDFSSSDEDSSSENKKRPIIKLSSQKQTNVLNKNESEKNNVSDTKVSKPNNDKIIKNKEKQNNNENISGNNLDSDEENQIFDKTNFNKTNDVKLCIQSKENIDKDYKNESPKSKINKSKKIPKSKEKTAKNVKNDSQTQINIPKRNIKSKEPQKINKRKCKSVVSAAKSPKITRSKKLNNKLLTSVIKQNTIADISNHLTENKINVSHQLFSDSREQELINTLDLTSEDVTKKKDTETCLSQPNEKDLYCSPYPLNYRNGSKRNKKNIIKKSSDCIKSCLLENQSDKQIPPEENQLKQETNIPDMKKNNELAEEEFIKKSESSKEVVGKNSENLSFKKAEKKTKKKTVGKVKQKNETFTLNDASKNINNIEIKNKETSEVKVSLGAVEDVTKNCELRKPPQQLGDEKTTKAKKSVFKLINELSYNENETGCAAVECWDVNSFKCGVFKLKAKSQMKCKTLHKNSHLGGSLIKGKLKMKIGNEELDLNQGDMAFVPPLTEWQATNIGDCESIFYYWCGRFKM